MVSVKFCGPGEAISQSDVPPGMSLVAVASWTGIATLRADCGGDLTCGTCLVQVPWAESSAASEAEQALLEAYHPDRAPMARLACQVRVPATSAELRVTIPGPGSAASVRRHQH